MGCAFCLYFYSLFSFFNCINPHPQPTHPQKHSYYHDSNGAWAVSTEVGTLNVLAYIMGDVLSAPPDPDPSWCWCVSTGRGYELDPRVTLSGGAVPPVVAAVLAACSACSLRQRPPPC